MEKNITIKYEHIPTVKSLSDTDQKLIKEAEKAVKNAYAPYSKFKVGAAVLLDNGEVVIGNNQENIAFPSGLCAERVALFAAGANYPNQEVVKLAIASKGDLVDKDQFLSPCGACRQVMAEVSMRQDKSFEIMILNNDGSILIFKEIKDLLPFIFGQ